MTLTFDIRNAFESQLTKAELSYETERKKIEALLAECGATKTSPPENYWHTLDKYRRKVNLLRKITESKHD
jgi:hypothetical protein